MAERERRTIWQRNREPGQQKIDTRGCRRRRAREGRGSEKSWRPMFRNK